MSHSPEVSESRVRSKQREADRQRARDERKAESAATRRRTSSGEPLADDPNDPLAAERRIWREKQRAKAVASGDASADGTDGMELSREDQVIMHAKKLQSENASTLKNTIKVARETTVVGAATIHKLNEQTEQFHRMDNALDETNDSLSRSERILRGMKSIGGTIGTYSSNTHTNCTVQHRRSLSSLTSLSFYPQRISSPPIRLRSTRLPPRAVIFPPPVLLVTVSRP